MPVIFARVDDRLIHGQIVQAWLPELNVDEIVIPCSKESGNCVNRGLLRLSLPYEYELTVIEASQCARYVTQSRRNIFLLMSSLQEFMPLVEDGLTIKSLNIGGMHFKQGAQKLDENVFLDEADKTMLRILNNLGISVETRAVPNATNISLTEALK